MFTPKQGNSQIKGPEDLYPDQIKKADELSLGDIQKLPQAEDDDLNFNEDDYAIRDAINNGGDKSETNLSHVKKGKKQRNQMDNLSQMSGNVSQYSYVLRPRHSNQKQNNPIKNCSGKKTQDKQARKKPQFEEFDDAASIMSNVSGVSAVSGFGAYQTRNYSHYKEATQN